VHTHTWVKLQKQRGFGSLHQHASTHFKTCNRAHGSRFPRSFNKRASNVINDRNANYFNASIKRSYQEGDHTLVLSKNIVSSNILELGPIALVLQRRWRCIPGPPSVISGPPSSYRAHFANTGDLHYDRRRKVCLWESARCSLLLFIWHVAVFTSTTCKMRSTSASSKHNEIEWRVQNGTEEQHCVKLSRKFSATKKISLFWKQRVSKLYSLQNLFLVTRSIQNLFPSKENRKQNHCSIKYAWQTSLNRPSLKDPTSNRTMPIHHKCLSGAVLY